MNKDTPDNLSNDELEDERAFSDTLLPGQDQEGMPPAASKGHEGGAPAAQTQTGVKPPPWAGKILGHFRLLRLIGKGAMGLVIQAEDTNLKRIVALKVLRKRFATGKQGDHAVEQFLREARAAAAIEHPNIVRVYEIDRHAGWWYIAMEMVTGNSLREIIKAMGALPAARACPIIADVATALQVAHELGIVHRDIKPGNILVTRNGHGKVSDFGLVQIDDPNDPVDNYAHLSIGTPYYMAPEMVRRETTGPAVDIYSLGATLYHILTGRPPFDSDNMKQVLKQHLNDEPPDLQQILPDCSPNLAALIQRMMAKEPELRPTAAAVAATLHAEAISALPETTATLASDGSTLGLDWQGILQKSRTPSPDQTVLTATLPVPSGLRAILAGLAWPGRIALAATGLLVLGALAFWLVTALNPQQDRRVVETLFPQASASYGTREINSLPAPVLPDQAPAFSWKGKVDTTGVQFVASQSGRTYYPIDDKRALLIRAEQFVGYSTADQAVKDGKRPAP